MQSQTESSWASACIRKSLISDKLKKWAQLFVAVMCFWLPGGSWGKMFLLWFSQFGVEEFYLPQPLTPSNLRDEQQWTKSYHPKLVLDLTCGSMGANPCSQVAKSCVKPSREAEAITVWHKHVHGLTMTCSAVTNGCNVQISSCMLHIT